MIQKPQKCWRYAIQTKHLREPSQSFHALQILLQDPTLSFIELSKQLDVDIQLLYNWSNRYFYRERIQAYQQEITEQLFVATTNYNKKLIEAETERIDDENTQFKNDFIIMRKKQQEIIDYAVRGESPPTSLIKEYNTMRRDYYSDKASHIKRGKDLQDIAIKPLEFTKEEKEEMNPNVQAFLDAMEGLRE